jgi:hypothetical protein
MAWPLRGFRAAEVSLNIWTRDRFPFYVAAGTWSWLPFRISSSSTMPMASHLTRFVACATMDRRPIHGTMGHLGNVFFYGFSGSVRGYIETIEELIRSLSSASIRIETCMSTLFPLAYRRSQTLRPQIPISFQEPLTLSRLQTALPLWLVIGGVSRVPFSPGLRQFTLLVTRKTLIHASLKVVAIWTIHFGCQQTLGQRPVIGKAPDAGWKISSRSIRKAIGVKFAAPERC